MKLLFFNKILLYYKMFKKITCSYIHRIHIHSSYVCKLIAPISIQKKNIGRIFKNIAYIHKSTQISVQFDKISNDESTSETKT